MPYGTVDQKRPLLAEDTEFQTVGCRHSNPDICKNNGTVGKCALVSENNLCVLPPKTWKKLFMTLKDLENKI
tara:strand:+ start:1174 stop:1389 length:216 start_codon:yes stop_codon:yes gene_type:complete